MTNNRDKENKSAPKNSWVQNVLFAFQRKKVAEPGTEECSPEPAVEQEIPCCSGSVHIAYRGVSDDKLYMAYARKWSETKFFRPHGLRVFCADCRRRLV